MIALGIKIGGIGGHGSLGLATLVGDVKVAHAGSGDPKGGGGGSSSPVRGRRVEDSDSGNQSASNSILCSLFPLVDSDSSTV
jgi:hypothetical protein